MCWSCKLSAGRESGCVTQPCPVFLLFSGAVLLQIYTQCVVHAPGRCVPSVITFLQEYVTPEQHALLTRCQGNHSNSGTCGSRNAHVYVRARCFANKPMTNRSHWGVTHVDVLYVAAKETGAWQPRVHVSNSGLRLALRLSVGGDHSTHTRSVICCVSKRVIRRWVRLSSSEGPQRMTQRIETNPNSPSKLPPHSDSHFRLRDASRV